MSFFKRFTRPRTGVSVSVFKSSFALGEDFEGKVTVESDEEADVKDVRLRLWCLESRKKTRIERDGEGNETERTYWDRAILFRRTIIVQGDFHLASGSKHEYPFSLTIPAGGRESYYSMDARVEWLVAAKVNAKGRRSPDSGTYGVQVTRPLAVPTVIKEREVITREVVVIPCAYCKGLMPQTSVFCPNCGARRKA